MASVIVLVTVITLPACVSTLVIVLVRDAAVDVFLTLVLVLTGVARVVVEEATVVGLAAPVKMLVDVLLLVPVDVLVDVLLPVLVDALLVVLVDVLLPVLVDVLTDLLVRVDVLLVPVLLLLVLLTVGLVSVFVIVMTFPSDVVVERTTPVKREVVVPVSDDVVLALPSEAVVDSTAPVIMDVELPVVSADPVNVRVTVIVRPPEVIVDRTTPVSTAVLVPVAEEIVLVIVLPSDVRVLKPGTAVVGDVSVNVAVIVRPPDVNVDSTAPVKMVLLLAATLPLLVDEAA